MDMTEKVKQTRMITKVLFVIFFTVVISLLMNFGADIKLLLAKKVTSSILLFFVQGIVGFALLIGLSVLFTMIMMWVFGLMKRDKIGKS